MRSLRAWLLTARVLCAATGAARAESELTSPPIPPNPTQEQIERALPDLGNPLDKAITGAAEKPLVVGTAPPPSLEALQAVRPGDETGDGIEPGRAEMIRTAALTYGAQGGLAARSFALNEMLRRYEPQLDAAYDFNSLVLPVGRGQTLMRPPVVSAAQMAFALGEGGQVARETSCISRGCHSSLSGSPVIATACRSATARAHHRPARAAAERAPVDARTGMPAMSREPSHDEEMRGVADGVAISGGGIRAFAGIGHTSDAR